MIDRKQAGRLMQQARSKKGLTQEQLGKKMNYTKQHISGLENGKNNFTDEVKDLLKQELGLNLYEFFSKGDTEQSLNGGVKTMIIKQLYEYNDMQDLKKVIDHILMQVEIDAAYEKTLKKLLEMTLYATIGYETYVMEPLRRDEEDYSLEWGYVAWSIDNLINDEDRWPISGTLSEERCQKKYSLLCKKLDYMAYEIGGILFEDFDDDGYKMGYVQQIGRMAEKSAYNIIRIIAGTDNSLITSYRAAILQLAEIIVSMEEEIGKG